VVGTIEDLSVAALLRNDSMGVVFLHFLSGAGPTSRMIRDFFRGKQGEGAVIECIIQQ